MLDFSKNLIHANTSIDKRYESEADGKTNERPYFHCCALRILSRPVLHCHAGSNSPFFVCRHRRPWVDSVENSRFYKTARMLIGESVFFALC
jgi:hypothetical protein